ncbi:hypothetical protein BDN72DRAFT_791936 [Pluteus cervinus]|uniref:Uncharacterized protein n=1 Tax=Pluteus cervinus TaxID=181527 RepID=A0ACD3B4B1_9AGAR|nr:hypothetical protein BDN72DRAFT_791936 [Pluteus cervinus]
MPVEWLTLAYHRMNVPVVTVDFCYLIQDRDLERASKILEELGLPLSPPSRLSSLTRGDLYSKGRFYRITQSSHPALLQQLAVFPLSFSTLRLSDLEEAPPCHISPSRCSTILVPRVASVYASILRLIRKYSQVDPVRGVLMSDLSQLVRHHLYKLECGYIDPSEEERWEALGIDKRIQDAVKEVESWDWRETEGWIRKAFIEVVASGNVEILPYAPSSRTSSE